MILVASDTTIVSPESAMMAALCDADDRRRGPYADRYRVYNLPEVRS